MDEIKLRLFKYRSCGSAVRDLDNGTLWFARPDTLNDTLETRFQSASADDFIRTIGVAVSEIAVLRGEPARDVTDANDPAFIEIMNRENDKLAQFCAGMGIFAAARRPDHQAMWAYYANNGAGVCFELEMTHPVGDPHQITAADVLYGTGARIHNRAEDLASVFRRVAAEHPSKSIDELWEVMISEQERRRFGIETATRAASRKHVDWQHEDEIRLLVPIAKAVPILKDTLKRVHFLGFNDPQISTVFIKLHQDYPGVDLVRWEYDNGEMHLRGQEMEIRAVPISAEMMEADH